MPVIRIKPATYERLERNAVGFKETPDSVLERALDAMDAKIRAAEIGAALDVLDEDRNSVLSRTSPTAF